MNPSAPVDWLSASVILITGIAVGAFLIWRFVFAGKPVKKEEITEHLELRDLEAKRDALILHLRELEDTASKGEPAQVARERYLAELEAAEVLRRIERLRPEALEEPVEEEEAPAGSGFLAGHPAVRGFVWGATTVAMVAGLGYLVVKYATERQPGGSATGAPAGMQQPQQAQGPDTELQALQQAVTNNPNDVNAHLDLAQGYLVRENLMPVFEQTQFVLDRDPENVRALTYQAFVRMAMGQMDQAREMLVKATTKDPEYVDAWVQTALLDTLTGRSKEAEQAIEEAVKRRPEEGERLRNLLAQMRAHENATPQQASAGPVPPMGGEAAAAPAAAADPGKAVSGVVDIPAGAAPAGQVLFVSLRPVGVASGAPLAVQRLAVSGFPVQFQLSQANSMMGQELPPKVRVEARLDADGDAMTRGPGDLDAVLDNVSLGTANIKLVLK